MSIRSILGAVALTAMFVPGGALHAKQVKIDLTLCARKQSIEANAAAFLREYAIFLRDKGMAADGARVQGYADALVAPPSGLSQFMGFDPRRVLDEYATALQKVGNRAHANEVRKAGQRYYDSNLACFVLQQRQLRGGQ